MTEIDTFTNEVGLFIDSRKKTKDLENLHRAFLVIPPSSVEAKRVFLLQVFSFPSYEQEWETKPWTSLDFTFCQKILI